MYKLYARKLAYYKILQLCSHSVKNIFMNNLNAHFQHCCYFGNNSYNCKRQELQNEKSKSWYWNLLELRLDVNFKALPWSVQIFHNLTSFEKMCVTLSTAVDFLKESRWLCDEINRIGCCDGLSFLLTLMDTEYKKVKRDWTKGSEISGAGTKDVTCWSVQRVRNPWPNKVPKDRTGAGVR